MTALAAYRDDGPLARLLVRALRAGPGAGRPHVLAWLVPPLLRALEYGSLTALAALVEPDASPMCFALLVVLAFHHYDTLYRLRRGGPPPPAWLGPAGGGWECRLLVAGALALAGVLEAGLLAGAIGLGFLYAAESGLAWSRFVDARRAPPRPEEAEALE